MNRLGATLVVCVVCLATTAAVIHVKDWDAVAAKAVSENLPVIVAGGEVIFLVAAAARWLVFWIEQHRGLGSARTSPSILGGLLGRDLGMLGELILETPLATASFATGCNLIALQVSGQFSGIAPGIVGEGAVLLFLFAIGLLSIAGAFLWRQLSAIGNSPLFNSATVRMQQA